MSAAFARNAAALTGPIFYIGPRQHRENFNREPAWTVKQFKEHAHKLHVNEIIDRALELVRVDNARESLDMLSMAREIAAKVHKGQRLKFKHHCVYLDNHVEPVTQDVHSTTEKSLAMLHDVPEQILTYIEEAFLRKKVPILNAENERTVIERILKAIAEEFRRHYVDMHSNSALIGNLRAITKLSTEKGRDGYKRYGRRMADHARATSDMDVIKVKLSDLRNNRDPDRNPTTLTSKHRDRLARYEWLDGYFRQHFRGVEIRPAQAGMHESEDAHDHKNHVQHGRQRLARTARGRRTQARRLKAQIRDLHT